MMITTAIIALQAAFVFPGGDDSALAGAIADFSKKPVFLLAAPGRVWKPTSFRVKNYDIPKRLLAARVGLSLPETVAWGFSGLAIPKFFLQKQNIRLYTAAFKTAAPTDADSRPGLFAIRTTSTGVFALEDIARMKLSKPLRWHWFFDSARLAADVRGSSELDMLTSLAAALGAKLVEDKESYFLDFSPRAFRARVKFLAMEARSVREEADAAYMSLLVQNLSDRQLIKLYSDPGGSIQVPIAWQSPLHQSVMRRFQATYEGDNRLMTENLRSTYELIKQEVDFSKAPIGELRADGIASAMFYGYKPKHFISM